MKIKNNAREEIEEELDEMEQEAEEKRQREMEEWDLYEESLASSILADEHWDYCPQCGDGFFIKGQPCEVCGFFPYQSANDYVLDNIELVDW